MAHTLLACENLLFVRFSHTVVYYCNVFIFFAILFSIVWTCCCLVTKSCLTLCDPMDCSTPDFPVHHQLPELTQSHVHWVGDAIQPSHPLLSPSPPAFNLSQHQTLYKWASSPHQVATLEFQLQHQSFQLIFKTGFLKDGLVGSLCWPRDSQRSSPTWQFKSINSLVLIFIYSPTLTSICDYWKKHSYD